MKPGIRSNPIFRITRRTGMAAAVGAWLSGCSAAGVLNALVRAEVLAFLGLPANR